MGLLGELVTDKTNPKLIYHTTTEGHVFSYAHLCTHLANAENVTCILIKQYAKS